MQIFPTRFRCACAILLILVGGAGILFAPTVGLFGGKETRSYSVNHAQEHSWGTSITTSEFELPFIHNQRGLFFMNLFLVGSVGAVFGGVHWLTGLNRLRNR